MNIFSTVKRQSEIESNGHAIPNEQLDDFLCDLTAVCAKHGIGITGTATLFLMEGEDRALKYIADEDSNLVLT